MPDAVMCQALGKDFFMNSLIQALSLFHRLALPGRFNPCGHILKMSVADTAHFVGVPWIRLIKMYLFSDGLCGRHNQVILMRSMRGNAHACGWGFWESVVLLIDSYLVGTCVLSFFMPPEDVKLRGAAPIL